MKPNDIINSLESGKALRLIKKSEQFESFDLQTRAALFSVAFPDLSDNDAAQIIQGHILNFYRYDVPFSNRVEARYIFQGTTTKNDQRKLIKKALLSNSESLGNMTIGEWINDFSKEFNVEQRSEEDVLSYMLAKKVADVLDENDKYILKDILHTYITLIESELYDVFDLVAIKKALESDKPSGSLPNSSLGLPNSEFSSFGSSQESSARSVTSPEYPRTNTDSSAEKRKTKMFPLEKALQKFPKLTQQRLTSSQITLKGTPESVPPTLKNWMTAYYQEIGPGPHEPFERSQFLFHNKNAVLLSQAERNILAHIFKSLDENTPLEIDPQTQSLIFENVSPAQEVRSQSGQSMPTPTSSPAPKMNPLKKTPAEELATLPENISSLETENPSIKDSVEARSQTQQAQGGGTEPIDPSPHIQKPRIPKPPSKSELFGKEAYPSMRNSSFDQAQPSPEHTSQNTSSATPIPQTPTKKMPEKDNTPYKPAFQERRPDISDQLSSARSFSGSQQPSLESTQVPPANTAPTSSFQQQLARAKKHAETKPEDYTDYYPIPKKNRSKPSLNTSPLTQRTKDTTKNMSFSSPQTLPHEKDQRLSDDQNDESGSLYINPPRE